MVEPEKLQKYSLFGGLLPDQIKQILPHMTDEFYNAGEDVIVEGTPNDRIWFIMEGRIAVIKNNITLCELDEGNTFGEMEVLDIMPSVATIKAITPTRTISMSNRGLREIHKSDLQSFSLIVMNLARDLSRRLRHMDEQAVQDTSRNVYDGSKI
ncbi:MAG: cyclic nucleotide-binding domain-containing protein [Spirochaetaceae bacterium]|jgi:CRP-like cAMP-binding protein|nr:cyclic nucleotide-binding domain-containing protein [Spirochaetaceae bacterium]